MVSNKEKEKEETDLDYPNGGNEWERGFTIEKNRVAEYVELYESIGYEIRVEPATPDEEQECQTCFKADFDNLRTIFIKKTKNKDNEIDL